MLSEALTRSLMNAGTRAATSGSKQIFRSWLLGRGRDLVGVVVLDASLDPLLLGQLGELIIRTGPDLVRSWLLRSCCSPAAGPVPMAAAFSLSHADQRHCTGG